ncbi:nitroreductase family deazaflavin-dependent oxidoreductase [Agromyces salentinus]|uniref:Nitroreductase family deazaflavin-dependent oxidoreductase n=2 Tax=Agromyces salentinus TaxID=269421 RepID=A0ABN2N0N6_9MICO
MDPELDSLADPRTNDDVIAAFRAQNGRVGGMFAGADLVLLTTRGARTGLARTTPVAARHEPDRFLVFATNAGAARDPAWLLNLRAYPMLEVEAPGVDRVERFAARAVEQSVEESARLYALQAADDPAFAAYRERTPRAFPVIALERIDDGSGQRRRA